MIFTQEEINVILEIFKNFQLSEKKIVINEFISIEKKQINLRSTTSFVPVMGFSVEMYFPNGKMNQIFEICNLVEAIKIIKKSQLDWELDCMFENQQ